MENKYQLRTYPDEILKQISSPVEDFSMVDELLSEMTKTLVQKNALGLAAVQIGELKRVFIIKLKNGTIQEFINPEIIEYEGTVNSSEGCLSFPGVSFSQPRYEWIYIKYLDRNKEERRAILAEIEAIVFQHELDHLNGITFSDKMNRQMRRAYERTLK